MREIYRNGCAFVLFAREQIENIFLYTVENWRIENREREENLKKNIYEKHPNDEAEEIESFREIILEILRSEKHE